MSEIAQTPKPPYFAVIFTSDDSIQNWKENGRHLIAQRLGKSQWYLRYKTRVTKVERDYGFEKD